MPLRTILPFSRPADARDTARLASLRLARTSTIVAGTLAVIAGCRSAPVDPAAARAAVAARATAESDGHRIDDALLDRPLRTGDRVDFSIVRSNDDGSVDREWGLSVIGPTEPFSPQSYDFYARIDVNEREHREHWRSSIHAGTVVAVEGDEDRESAEGMLALGMFERGLVEGLERGFVIHGSMSIEGEDKTDYSKTLRPLIRAIAQFQSIAQVVTTHPLPRKIVMANVDRPSLLSLIGGIDIGAMPSVYEAEAVETEFGPGFRIPFDITVNETLAFVGAVTAVEPRGVLTLTAGVVAIEGAAPSRPNRVLQVRLVGAQAGEDGRTVITRFETDPKNDL